MTLQSKQKQIMKALLTTVGLGRQGRKASFVKLFSLCHQSSEEVSLDGI